MKTTIERKHNPSIWHIREKMLLFFCVVCHPSCKCRTLILLSSLGSRLVCMSLKHRSFCVATVYWKFRSGDDSPPESETQRKQARLNSKKIGRKCGRVESYFIMPRGKVACELQDVRFPRENTRSPCERNDGSGG